MYRNFPILHNEQIINFWTSNLILQLLLQRTVQIQQATFA